MDESSKERSYIAIDLKSFYASVECVDRRLDPLTTNLVVADLSRTEKTICLAVSPSLKACGLPGRPRLFEVTEKIREVNRARLSKAIRSKRAVRNADGQLDFSSASFDALALEQDPSLELSCIVAPPRMARYIEYSTKIYQIYLKFIAPEDIHCYSIDEVFMDVTAYLNTYHMTPHELAMTMIREVLYTTGITATAGIGTNLYLAKVAMDIVAKRVKPDQDGVRIAELDELTYRKLLWDHRPLTDFWRVGPGYAKKLEARGIYTMGDVARCSIRKSSEYHNEELLYRLFGVNAELLIDHAWGWEPCTIADVKAYKPEANSLGSGQVLQKPYPFEKARLVLREMTDALVLDLVEKGLMTDQIVVTVGYDRESLNGNGTYRGDVVTDRYGREIPKHAHGSASLGKHTSSTRLILDAATSVFDERVNPALLVRRINVTACHVLPEREVTEQLEQLSLFTGSARQEEREREAVVLDKERRLQQAILTVKKKYGKNAMLKGVDLEEDATAILRNGQIGGHKA